MAYIALVTGASSGIGEATARRLSREPDTHVVLVARRRERLEALAAELAAATVICADLTDQDAPQRIRATLEREHGGTLHMLVNNAGAAWRGGFGETGWANVERHMQLNFEAPLRLTEALLPLLRATAAAAAGSAGSRRVCIVNVSSTAGRVSRPGSGAYSASKFALAGWSDALYAEERPHGVHVGLVLPGFVSTEGFPGAELKANPATRWLLGRTETVAEAILDAGPGGRPERYAPRAYGLVAVARAVAPGIIRRATAGGAFTTRTARSSD